MTAEILPGSGQAVNDAEREVIFYLRGNLPNNYKILHNIEIKRGVEFFEIDLVILAPHCIYVVDIKGTYGQINVYGNQWHPEGRSPFHSPLPKLRQHAKTLKSLICDFYPARQDLGSIYVHAAVLMADPEASIYDPDGRDESNITYADQRCLTYFRNQTYLPHWAKSVQPHYQSIIRALAGRTNPQSALPCFGNWQVEEKLGETDRYIEYRAKDIENTDIGITARLRVYQVDPYQDEADRDAERKRIRTAFEAVYQRLKHRNILPVQAFFTNEGRDRHILVTDDFSGHALRQYLKRKNLTLTLAQKLSLIEEVLDALRYAHENGIIHRNITPDTILVDRSGHACLTGFDYARLSHRDRTIAHDIIDDLQDSQPYQAPECHDNPAAASTASDLFSVGLAFYELLTETPAFQNGAKIRQTHAQLPDPSQLSDLLPGLDQWFQKLCAYEIVQRFSNADEALKEFAELQATKVTASAANTISNPDPANLPQGSEWDNHFIIEEFLGTGNFCHAYRAIEILSRKPRVLKIVTRDRHSVFQRLLQEYCILEELPPHPHVVKVEYARLSVDQIPYIVFEYVEGKDVATLLNQNLVSLDQAIQIAQQTASGLAHLHQHAVFHQDIKPSNLLWTEDGVRIIDFNIAVSAQIESQIEKANLAATHCYLPPNYDVTIEHSHEEKIDRDLYALGVTFYECVTGHYPFNEQEKNDKQPRHPQTIEGCENLSDAIAQILLKAISPDCGERFSSAEAFLKALLDLSKPPEATIQFQNITTDSVDALLPVKTQLETSLANPSKDLLKVSESACTGHSSPAIADPLNTPPPNPPNAIDFFGKPGKKAVILDPTGLHQPIAGAITIANEVDWMQSFFVTDGLYWVHGKNEKIAKQLCELTETWLQIHHQTDVIIETKQPPHLFLQSLFHPLPIPSEWTGQQLQNLANWITNDSQETAIARLLTAVTGEEESFWLGTPSIEHLAYWLTIRVPQRYQVLEQVWQYRMATHTPSLATYYQTTDKPHLLRQWLGLTEPALVMLGAYPLTIPEWLLPEYTATWEEQIVLTKGQILDRLIPQQQPAMEQLAAIAYSVMMKQRPLITSERIQKLSTYLSSQKISDLEKNQQLSPPMPLQPHATMQEVFSWVTEQYLPFRQREVANHQNSISNTLAESFVEWIVQHYPALRMEPDVMNTSVASLVQDLCREAPVLWVVVDGLGWLDHQELILYLAENHKIVAETALQPRLSVLPTVTKYAKWSLYSQLLPGHPSWIDDMKKGFSSLGLGKHYSDKDQKKLHQDLKQNKHSLYCWDTTQLDKLYHDKQNWQNFQEIQRPRCLKQLAEDIAYCVSQHPQSEQLKIVIATDHGQMMGEVLPLSNCPNFQPEERMGRVAIGRVDDPGFVILERDRFGIPEDMSVVKGAAYIPSYSYKAGHETAISSHGGLFPEEVVVGVSVLRRHVERSSVLVLCKGEGSAKQPGELVLTIHNLNTVPLTHLCLYINELPALKAGLLLEARIPPQSAVPLQIPISEFPELSPGHLNNQSENQINLSGKLTFRYAVGESGEAFLSTESSLTIQQIFSSGFDIDEFL
jgi:serine/threonine protein kinase